MTNDPWTGARLGTDFDSPLGGSYQAETVNELGKWVTPGFATAAARDAALAAWVANGNTALDGMTCWVKNIGVQVLVSGSWSTDILAKPTASTLTLTSNYQAATGTWGATPKLRQLGARCALQGTVTNAVAPYTANAGVEYKISQLPAGTAPSDVRPFAVAFGNGSTFGGGAVVVRPDGTVNFLPYATVSLSTGSVGFLSLALDGPEWVVGV